MLRTPVRTPVKSLADGPDSDAFLDAACQATGVLYDQNKDLGKRYYDHVVAVVGTLFRERLANLMNDTPYYSAVLRNAQAEGQAMGKVQYLLQVLETRNVKLSDSLRQMVLDTTDPEQLDTWFARALTAHTAEDVFAPRH
ncbi:hypothetical protein [Actinomadura flavalba]|uniref:hypothetical protein n=1 Tax=Actinomadura flavalba TaxID=1120938 RepID=UPI000366C7CB|nr:hypothetical protein [Actinomadura flavalba]